MKIPALQRAFFRSEEIVSGNGFMSFADARSQVQDSGKTGSKNSLTALQTGSDPNGRREAASVAV
jgi:hypothetical protein